MGGGNAWPFSIGSTTGYWDHTSFFFFQAEDGIRDYKVTGVQTCALPIFLARDVGQVADGAAGHLGVLAADGGRHVLGRELVALQLGGIEPDAHRLFGTEQLDRKSVV